MTKSFEEIYNLFLDFDAKLAKWHRNDYLVINRDNYIDANLELRIAIKELCEENQRLKAEIEQLKGTGDESKS